MKMSHGAAIVLCAWVVGFSVLPALGSSILIASDVQADQLVSLDPTTGAKTVIGPLADDIVAGLGYDAVHDILYASSTWTSGGRNLLRVDYNTGAVTIIGPLGQGGMHGLEYNPARDILYGITTIYSNKLWQINVATGAAIEIGTHGINGLSGLAYDYVNDIMYAGDSMNKQLFTINLDTGAATLVGPFNGPTGNRIGNGLAWDPEFGLLATDTHADTAYNDELYSIDVMTGQATLIGATGTGNALGLAFVPEPTSLALLGCGLLIAIRRR